MTLPNRENYVVRPRPKMVQQMQPPPVSEYRPTFVPPQDHIPPMSTMHVHFSPPAAQTQVTTTSSSAGSAAQPIHVPETAEDRTQYAPETHGETKLNFSKLSELFPLAGTSKVTRYFDTITYNSFCLMKDSSEYLDEAEIFVDEKLINTLDDLKTAVSVCIFPILIQMLTIKF